MTFVSPLRYPGGKGLLFNFVSQVLSDSMVNCSAYVEPFAGGAGVALRLLYHEKAKSIVIGDADPAIAAFWRAVVNHNEDFIDLLYMSQVTLDEWHSHWSVVASESRSDDLELGFSAFFLNRTNHSGILRARPIGGLDQSGKWKLDCRFNKTDLVDRIKQIGRYKDQIVTYEGEASMLLDELSRLDTSKLFIYADPPYLNKSKDLYLNEMNFESHQEIGDLLRSSFKYWMTSYDVDRKVGDVFYPDCRILSFGIRHSASRAHIGQELAAFSNSCKVDEAVPLLKNPHWMRHHAFEGNPVEAIQEVDHLEGSGPRVSL